MSAQNESRSLALKAGQSSYSIHFGASGYAACQPGPRHAAAAFIRESADATDCSVICQVWLRLQETQLSLHGQTHNFATGVLLGMCWRDRRCCAHAWQVAMQPPLWPTCGCCRQRGRLPPRCSRRPRPAAALLSCAPSCRFVRSCRGQSLLRKYLPVQGMPGQSRAVCDPSQSHCSAG